ncbi:hypothetical protein Poly51_19630 [Rubripirellula tenax]|uniref:DUF4350 domain-containing protein n=1 Tax=Rubripirellula tenax TaxID=2528015 RepID=A0A5C6FEM8_9BACT|nr:hypothetical protein [Rubripirellula tenax]TWU59177.1 hypothetical protein Poly51_19630 [Rubripirellula tenax]
MNRQYIYSLVVLLLIATSGCSDLVTDYGESKGLKGQSSLNGFGALRNSYELSGFRARDVSRLTDRVGTSDAIVWTPQLMDGVDSDVTKWFERWLAKGNKTLVYVVPDSGSEADYWIEASRLAEPAQRIEYRKRAGQSINQRMIWRLNRKAMPSNGWFQVQPLEHRIDVDVIKGEWSSDLAEKTRGDKTSTGLFAEFSVEPYDSTVVVPPATGFVPTGPTGPSSPGFSSGATVVPSKTETTFRSFVSHGDDSVVAEIRSTKWKGSKILVVAGGSLLTNFALAHQANAKLAAKIVNESTPSGVASPVAGFLTSDWMGVPVSESTPGVPVASGMELLTVWPLSLVTMHGALLGFVICLMLWPILGRPKRVHTSEHTHFGDHLDAVAGLMNRAGGEDYARARISEYFKRVRGETSGPWVLADQIKDQVQSAPLPSLGARWKNVPPEKPATAPPSPPSEPISPDEEIS